MADASDDERQLLGCVLAGADPLDIAIDPAQFWQPVHEQLWRDLCLIADSGKRCDLQTVVAHLGARIAKLDGGAAWLHDLAQYAVPSNAPVFAGRVRAHHARRQLADIARGLLQRAEDPELDPDDIRETARGMLDQPASHGDATHAMADLVPAFMDRLQAGEAPGLSLPWEDLDAWLHGLHPGRLYVVGGRPGGGKSVMLANIAAHFAGVHRVPVWFATLEMPARELVTRIVSARTRVAQTNILTGHVTEDDWGLIDKHVVDLSGMPLHISDDSGHTLRTIRTAARNLKRKHGLGLIVVDYLQLLTPDDRRLSRQQQIGELTRGLKRLAKELEVPVVTASQLRRPTDRADKSPTLSDLRESGDIEADADAVILLHTENEDQPWDLKAIVAKNRSGPKGPVDLAFDTTRADITTPNTWRRAS